MDTEIKTKWLDALRSGKYRQGANYLRTRGADRDNYCCLGVLCELAVAEGVIEPPVIEPTGEYYYAGDSAAYLPAEVRRWADLPDSMGHFLSDGNLPHNSLTEMNDSEYPFTEIADVIEEKF